MRLTINDTVSKFAATSLLINRLIMQFPCVKPTGRSYYCAKEEFHANFYSFINSLIRAETKALIGGGVYSYIRVLPDEFLLKSVVITVDFKRNSSGRTRIYEYAPPPP